MNHKHDLLESDLRGQTRVLSLLAQGASLDQILDALVEVAEQSRPELIASILLLDHDSGCLRHGASRRLPGSYCAAIDGVMPGPKVGSCGTTAFRGRRVVVEDINTDPLWVDYRDVALKASLQACWSEPIIASTGEVLGTFAMYYNEPRSPDESDLEFVSSSANLAALAIERVRYQNEVEGERAMLKTIVNSIPDALLSAKLNREITHFNRAASRMFGYEREEVLGKAPIFLYANSDDYARLGKERFRSGLDDIFEATEVQWRRKSGETFPGELVATSIRDEDGEAIGFLGLIRDITDRKVAEAHLAESRDKLLHAERLAAMGQMVSAIAHESRNALQRIQVGVDVLQYEIQADSESRVDIDRISRAKNDLQQLHDELRSFAGPIHLNRKQQDLAEVWRQAWAHCRVGLTDRDAELAEEIAGVDLTCHIDAFRIEQVFRNLFENSLAACDDPVRVTVTCCNTDFDGAPALSVAVRDNGPGLSEELRSRVFEPFFTTKSKGMGLGMAIAERFVQAHGGMIEVGDDQRGAAEFLISLPRKAQ